MRPRLRKLARTVLPPVRRRVENLAWRLEALEDDAREPFPRRAVADTDPLPKWFAAAVRPPFGTVGPVPQTIEDLILLAPDYVRDDYRPLDSDYGRPGGG